MPGLYPDKIYSACMSPGEILNGGGKSTLSIPEIQEARGIDIEYTF